MRYEFLTEYPCKYFLWPPIWVKAIRTAGSTAEGRSYRHYWFLIMESTAFCCWVKNSILWVALFSCVGCASTCKSVNKSSKSKYLLYRLWSFVILLPVFYKDIGGYFPVNCPVNVFYSLGLPAFCARKTGGKSGFFKQVETLLRICLLFLCHKISRACLPVKRSWGDGRKIKAVRL